jgi:hypothetical protein
MADTAAHVPSRAELRATILKTRKPNSKVITFFEGQIELRQPILGDIIAAQESEDRESAIIDILVKYAYVPGTDEKVFEDSDADVLKTQPFGKDFLALSKAFEELSEVNFLDKKAS